MRKTLSLVISLATLAALPATAFAQDAAATPPPGAPGEPPPAPPGAAAEVPAPSPAPVPEAAPNTTAAPAAEAAPGTAAPIPAWIRFDSDIGGLQFWAGGTWGLSETLGLAFDMYVNSGTLAEFDIGPAITAGPFIVTPMLGFQTDWAAYQAAALVPQLYVTGGPDPIYAELWLQYYNYDVFDYAANSYLYARLFVDFKLSPYVAIGPEIDITNTFGDVDELTSFAIGPNVLLSNVGPGGSFIGWLGYETKDGHGPIVGENGEVDDKHLTGRLTYIKTF